MDLGRFDLLSMVWSIRLGGLGFGEGDRQHWLLRLRSAIDCLSAQLR